METILQSIRKKSQSLPVSDNHELDDFMAYSRIIQIHGMLELTRLLSESEVQVPAILAGGLRAEIDYLKRGL